MAPGDDEHGYRSTYLDYEALTAQLRAWAEAYPRHTRLHSIGQTPEGRELWVLTIGADPDCVRPAAWVDANMHGAEVSGTSVALAIAEAALRFHAGEQAPPVAPAMQHALERVHLHICPRVSPDGAERVLDTGRFVRSVPRSQSGSSEAAAHWQAHDVDGDGVARYMRVPDPGGAFVESHEIPGVMLPRRPEDPPPYYHLYPEGTIAHWDGSSIPEPDWLHDTTDLNRNFAWDWQPEPEQAGAGAYPGSEPESQAVLRWSSAHPELYAWLNLHTFGGVFIRPLGSAPDSHMRAGDRRIYRQLEQWGDAIVGYPTVNGYEEFTYEPQKPLHGDLTDYAYHQRGCLALVCELWDLFAQADLPQPRPFVERYTALERDDIVALARWDGEANNGRIFQGWHALEHPQLGQVEVGGPDPRVGIWNPPYEHLPTLCDRMARYWLHVAALLPVIEFVSIDVEALGDDLHRVAVEVANRGYLPTWGAEAARERPVNSGLRASLRPSGCELVDSDTGERLMDHLAGWGRGLGHGGDMPWLMRSDASDDRVRLTWLVRGQGTARIIVGSARVGWYDTEVTLDV